MHSSIHINARPSVRFATLGIQLHVGSGTLVGSHTREHVGLLLLLELIALGVVIVTYLDHALKRTVGLSLLALCRLQLLQEHVFPLLHLLDSSLEVVLPLLFTDQLFTVLVHEVELVASAI